mgnify:CR=1 FL=1
MDTLICKAIAGFKSIGYVVSRDGALCLRAQMPNASKSAWVSRYSHSLFIECVNASKWYGYRLDFDGFMIEGSTRDAQTVEELAFLLIEGK